LGEPKTEELRLEKTFELDNEKQTKISRTAVIAAAKDLFVIHWEKLKNYNNCHQPAAEQCVALWYGGMAWLLNMEQNSNITLLKPAWRLLAGRWQPCENNF